MKDNIFKFAHTTDWHAGNMQGKELNVKTKRFHDIFNAIDQIATSCINLIENNELDFIIHTGDLFDSSRPTSGTYQLLIPFLQSIKEAFVNRGDIKYSDHSLFFIIRGNHDAPSRRLEDRGGHVLQVLHDLKLITYIDDDMVGYKDVRLYGVGHHDKLIKEKLAQVIDQHKIEDKYANILMLHEGIDEYKGNLSAYISIPEITNSNFAYVGVGHYHTPFLSKNNFIGNPGSIEHIKSSEWDSDNENRDKMWYHITLSRSDSIWKVSVAKQMINVRPKRKLTINLKNKESAAIEKQIEDELTPYIKQGHILYVKIIGELPKGFILKNYLDVFLRNQDKKLLEFRHSHQAQFSSSPSKKFVKEETIIEHFLEEKGIPRENMEKWLSLINKSKELLGDKNMKKDRDEFLEIKSLIEEE
jgi:DNA repair exonuclease SbcCD nuclease subunit